jgi:hypothetical protein
MRRANMREPETTALLRALQPAATGRLALPHWIVFISWRRLASTSKYLFKFCYQSLHCLLLKLLQYNYGVNRKVQV